jgi:hypothetical protein
MAGYKFTTFDGVTLPEYEPEHDLTPAPVTTTLERSIGGVFDRYGSTRRLPNLHTIEYTGTYIGETTYLVDESGNFVVDESGNFIIAGDSVQWLRNQVDALVEKEGIRGNLIRQRLDDSANQWKQARLLTVRWRSMVEDNCIIAEVRPQFEIAHGAWKDETVTTTSDSLIVGGLGLNVENGGMIPIHDAIITVTATNQIAALTVTELSGIDWTFSGTIAAGTSLVIDCGAQTILNNGSNAYSNFTLNSGHSVEGWLPLPRGTSVLQIQSDAIGTFSVGHYDQWL